MCMLLKEELQQCLGGSFAVPNLSVIGIILLIGRVGEGMKGTMNNYKCL